MHGIHVSWAQEGKSLGRNILGSNSKFYKNFINKSKKKKSFEILKSEVYKFFKF